MNNKKHNNVSVYIGCASMLLPDLLQYLKKRTPDIRYQIFQWNDSPEHEYDISLEAFDDVSTERNSSKKIKECLMTERILLAVPSNHSLAQKPHIEFSNLINEEFICLNSKWGLENIIHNELTKHKFEPHIIATVDNPNLMRDLLAKGIGVAFVPEISWHEFAGVDVVMREVDGLNIKRKICMCYSENNYLTKEQLKCMEGIRNYFTTSSLHVELED